MFKLCYKSLFLFVLCFNSSYMNTAPDKAFIDSQNNEINRLQKQIEGLLKSQKLAKHSIYQAHLNELEGQVLSWDKELEKYRLKFLLLDRQTQALYVAGGLGAVYITYCILSKLFGSSKKKRRYRDYDYE